MDRLGEVDDPRRELARALAELDRLRAEVQSLRLELIAAHGQCIEEHVTRAELDRLRAENERLRASMRPAVGRVLEELNAAHVERDRLRAENERLRTAGRGSTIWASALDDRDRYRDALRELVEAHDAFLVEQSKANAYLMRGATDRARALLQEVGGG
jgi:hypothetical protein